MAAEWPHRAAEGRGGQWCATTATNIMLSVVFGPDTTWQRQACPPASRGREISAYADDALAWTVRQQAAAY